MLPRSEPLSIGLFRAANNWPVYVAAEKGFFEQKDLKVDLIHISSSRDQLESLINGRFQIIHTAADNVLAAASAAAMGEDKTEKTEPKIFMGGDDGFLSVFSSPKIMSPSDLNGKNVGFDSATSGFAFVLKKILSKAGLEDDRGYNQVVVGGTELRYKALVEGRIDAAVMTPPHDLLSLKAGMRKMADVYQYFTRYQGVVGATCAGFLDSSQLRTYRTCFVRGLDWLSDSSNKGEAVRILKNYLQLESEDDVMSNLYDSMVLLKEGHNHSGFSPGAEIDFDGLAQVASLRIEFSHQSGLGETSKYLIQL